MTPAAGPHSTIWAGRSRAASAESTPPEDCMTSRRPADAGGGELADHGGEVVLHGRADVGVDHGRAGALVLADLRQHLGRERDEPVRAARRGAGRRSLLVDRVGEGVDEADGDRLHFGGADGGDRGIEARRIERADDRAVGADALGHLEAQVARHQRRRLASTAGHRAGGRARGAAPARRGNPAW